MVRVAVRQWRQKRRIRPGLVVVVVAALATVVSWHASVAQRLAFARFLVARWYLIVVVVVVVNHDYSDRGVDFLRFVVCGSGNATSTAG